MKSHASMNRIYRLVFNAALGIWVAVAENAKGRGKGGRAASALIAVLAIISPNAYAANAADATRVGGAGTVTTVGNTTTINQTSQRLALDWTQLSTTANEALIFNQPNAQAIALNRITGITSSSFMGSLTATGQVFILNPNGILFGAGSQVNVGGIVASTLDMNPNDFMNGSNTFTKTTGRGSVVNQGTMTAASGGYLALLAPEVRNEGVMTASLGTALLAAGNKVTLNLDNGSLLGYSIDQGAINALAENKQLIKADGGQVLLSAKAMDALTTATVNNTGVIEARTIQNKAGRILLMGDMEHGTVNVGGTLDASAPTGGNGGFIETSAAHVKVATGTRVTTQAATGQTGKWLIDPNDFTISATGDMSAATVVANLASTNFEIQTATMGTAGGNGDIHVNQALTWSSANTLTLTAARNININQAITASNGGLTLNAVNQISAPAAVSVRTFTLANGVWSQIGALPSFSATDFRITGGTFIRALGGDGGSVGTAYELTDAYGLQGAGSANMLNQHYKLANHIDASGTSGWNSGAGFKPIGDYTNRFTGKFDGNNKTISGLTINRAGTSFVGLFGGLGGGSLVGNLGLVGGSVKGGTYTGALAGIVEQSNISNSYSTASVIGYASTGGLVGYQSDSASSITNSYATGSVNGTNSIGGLVGINYGNITNSYATGTMTGIGQVGALVGEFVGGNVTASFWKAGATPGFGYTNGGTSDGITRGLTNAEFKSTATFTSASWNASNSGGDGKVWRIYEGNTGPLLRSFMAGLSLTDTTLTYNGSTQAGATTGDSRVLGSSATGRNAGGYASSYYSTQQGVDIIGGGLAIGQANLTLSTSDVAKTYDGNISALGVAIATSGTQLFGTDSISGGTFSFTNKNTGAGNKTVTTSGVSVNDGTSGNNYNVSYANNTSSTITPKALTVSGITADNKVYDQTSSATVNTGGAIYSGLVSGDVLSVSTTGAFTDKNAATGKTVNLSSNYLGADAGNYAITDQASTTANITPKALTVSGVTAANKVYDQTTIATVSTAGAVYGGLIAGDVLAVSATGTFSDKNAAIGKTVNLASSYLGADVGNYLITDQATTTANITPKALTVSGISAANKTYDQNTTATVNTTGAVYSGLIAGDVLAVNVSGIFSDKNAANGKTINLTSGYTGADVNNYAITSQATTTASITQKALTVSGITADNKTYDQTTNATVSTAGVAYSGLIAGDVLAVNVSGTFSDKNAANGKTVNLTSGYSGTDVGNYAITSQTTTTANISQKALTVSGITAANKGYDQTTSATVSTTGATYSGLIAGDALAVSATGVFSDKNAANGKTVNLTSGYSGADVGNYAITSQAGTTANITPRALNVTVTANNKVYNANTSTSASLITDLIFGDVLLAPVTLSFSDKNVGVAKTVNYSISPFVGADAGNYVLAVPSSGVLTADITPKALTVSGITAASKVYDQNTSATVSTAGAVYSGLISGDMLAVNASGTFSDKNAASGKTVTLISGYSGADVGNYTITSQVITLANITPKTLTVSAAAQSKVYDGATAATLTYTDNRIAGDVLAFTSNANFSDKNVGAAKSVTYNSLLQTGADAGNYTLSSTSGTTSANITQKALTVSSITAANKTYDQTTAATISSAGATYSGLIAGDALAVSATGVFSDKNAATGKTVNLTSSYSGADVGNYAITSQTTTTANITPKALAVSGVTASNKTYDQTTAATVSTAGATYSGLISGDVLAVNATGTFSDKNAATGKTVNLTSGYTGADVNNYAITNQASTTANITQKALTVSGITADNKVYDQTSSATVNTGSAIYSGLVSGDVLSVSTTGAFTDKNAASGKTVNLTSGYTGADVNNYVITNQATTTANITQKALTVSGITANNKVYDQNTSATVSTAGAAYSGLIAGDVLAVSATGLFTDKNAATGKTVNLTNGYTGADVNNYAITSQASTTASITPKDLTVTTTAQNKVYDATTAATLAYTDNRIAGDVLGFTNSASFSDKNVGTSKTVNFSGLAQTGTDAGNYTLVSPTSGASSANITPAPLLITANNDSRLAGAPYSGGNGVVYSGLVGGETASVLTGALTYGGSSQGASAAGSYAITPGGQASSNYAISFNNGSLTLTPASAAVSVGFAGLKLDLTNPVVAYNSTLSSFSSSFKSDIAAALNVDTAKINVQSLNNASNDE
jgi:filamentous hemagglutinin family protein